jgi:hypothetical protein
VRPAGADLAQRFDQALTVTGLPPHRDPAEDDGSVRQDGLRAAANGWDLCYARGAVDGWGRRYVPPAVAIAPGERLGQPEAGAPDQRVVSARDRYPPPPVS